MSRGITPMIAPLDHDPVKVPATLGNRPCCRASHSRISPPGASGTNGRSSGNIGDGVTETRGLAESVGPRSSSPKTKFPGLLEAQRIEGSMSLLEVEDDDFAETGPEIHPRDQE